MVKIVVIAHGAMEAFDFLLDTGATRTILSRATVANLGIQLDEKEPYDVEGVGGMTSCVPLTGRLGLLRETGEVVAVEGPFLAFLSPDAGTDNLLGNDVLNNFDVIVSYPRREVVLLAGTHRYEVVG